MNPIDKEETSKIYRRACMIHLVKKPYIHLNWAAFEEERGIFNNGIKDNCSDIKIYVWYFDFNQLKRS